MVSFLLRGIFLLGGTEKIALLEAFWCVFLFCFYILSSFLGGKKQIKRFGFLLAFLGWTRQILLPGASWLCLLPPGLDSPRGKIIIGRQISAWHNIQRGTCSRLCPNSTAAASPLFIYFIITWPITADGNAQKTSQECSCKAKNTKPAFIVIPLVKSIWDHCESWFWPTISEPAAQESQFESGM